MKLDKLIEELNAVRSQHGNIGVYQNQWGELVSADTPFSVCKLLRGISWSLGNADACRAVNPKLARQIYEAPFIVVF